MLPSKKKPSYRDQVIRALRCIVDEYCGAISLLAETRWTTNWPRRKNYIARVIYGQHRRFTLPQVYIFLSVSVDIGQISFCAVFHTDFLVLVSVRFDAMVSFLPVRSPCGRLQTARHFNLELLNYQSFR